MTRLSQAERRSVIERFYEKVSDGIKLDPEWVRQTIDASIPELPDEPTPEQCDAWIELSGILSNPGFISSMRSNASNFWDQRGSDPVAYRQAYEQMWLKAKEATDRGLGPASEHGAVLIQDWLKTLARAMGRESDATFRIWLYEKYTQLDELASRYWELVAIMNGQPPQSSPSLEWRWFIAAIRHHLQ